MAHTSVSPCTDVLPLDVDALQQAIADSFEGGAGTPDGQPGKGRQHQVASVVQLVEAVRRDCHAANPPSYLLQHSAGSGKSLTIAALVAALLKTEDEQGRGFHTVLVVNDRLQLDQQLGDTIAAFMAGNGFPGSTVARASSSSQLRSILLTPPGTPSRPAVVLTTIQKLGSLWRNAAAAAAPRTAADASDSDSHDAAGLTLAESRAGAAAGTGQADLASVLSVGRVAIIADEAHRHHDSHTSQQISDILAAVFGGNGSSTGSNAQQLVINKTMKGFTKASAASTAGSTGGRSGGNDGGASDGVLQQRHQPRFVTYFGFTATPGPRALQLFGVAHQVQVDVLGSVVGVQQPQQVQAPGSNGQEGASAEASAANSELHLAPAILFTPFHCYSLQQAIADGLVLDVLQRFVAVTPRFQIAGLQLTQQQRLQLMQLDAASRAVGLQVAGSNPAGPRSTKLSLRDELGIGAGTAVAGNANGNGGAAASLAEGLLIQAASNSGQLVATKAQDVVLRFMDAWIEAANAGFTNFRAMVVVRSRQHVVWYCQEIRRLLKQHNSQIQTLLAASGEDPDWSAAEAAAQGDMAPLCYGAYSGTIVMAAAEAQQLCSPTPLNTPARGSRQQQQQQRQQQRQQQKRSSGWDAALAEFDQEQAVQQEQQQVPPQQADHTQDVVVSSRKRQRKTPAAAPAASSKSQSLTDSALQTSDVATSSPNSSSSSGSSSDSEYELSDEEQKSNDCNLFSSSDSDSHAAAAAIGIGTDGLSDTLPPRQQIHAAADLQPHLQRKRYKRIRRDPSTLSQNTTNQDAVAAAAVACDAGAGTASAGLHDHLQQQQQQQSKQQEVEDEQPLLKRWRQQRQQLDNSMEHGQMPAAAAAAVAAEEEQAEEEAEELLVPISERDLNSVGFSHADARLLVVCSKFETGYDDPRLGAIFIDRPLSGARAVQVLGRINRPAPGKGGGSSSNDTSTATAAAAAADDASADAAAAAAPSAFRVLVVDFVNSVGAIREAFSQFYGATTYCTGSQAKRLRQQQALDDCLSRVLEVLQPAAARAAAAAALGQRMQQEHDHTTTSSAAAAAAAAKAAANNNTSSSSDISGSLAAMSVGEMVQLICQLAPETQRAVEDDLATYCSLCLKLRLEKVEFPYVFAAALHSSLTAARQRRDKAASTGRFAWMDKLTAEAGVEDPNMLTATAAMDLEAAADVMHDDKQQHQQQQQQQESQVSDDLAAPSAAAAKLQQKLRENVRVNVVELEETFAGAVRLNPADVVKPLHSVKLSSHLTNNMSGGKANNLTAGAQVKAGRPLHEVIAAANAQLAGRYRKQVAAGLSELCDKLRSGGDGSSTAAAAAAVQQSGAGREQGQHQQGTEGNAARTNAAAADHQDGSSSDAAAAAAAAAEGDDVYTVLTLLRRLQLWPVTAELLRTTAAGKQVAALAKTHTHPMVRSLAAQVVAQWKAILASQAAAAAAAARELQRQQQAAAGNGHGDAAAPAAQQDRAVIKQELRDRVVSMMREALTDHRAKVLQQQQDAQQQQHQGLDKSKVSQSELRRLQILAEELEQELHTCIIAALRNGSGNGHPAAAAADAGSRAGSAAAEAAVQDYKKRARMLCTGLRYPDGVAQSLIAGDKAANEVVRLDALELTPTAVQEAIAKRREEQRRSEEVWEQLVSESIGGGGTYVTTDVKCPQCGESKAQVHTILSGGTYAQERQTIQKYVCKQCNFTWRSDS